MNWHLLRFLIRLKDCLLIFLLHILQLSDSVWSEPTFELLLILLNLLLVLIDEKLALLIHSLGR